MSVKIGFISLGIHGTEENYGALLQMLAFKTVLKQKYGYDAEVINYYGLSTKYTSGTGNSLWRRGFHKIKKILISWVIPNSIEARLRKNESFIKNNFTLSNKYTFTSIDYAKFDYDVCIVESDVVWDPTFRDTGFDRIYFLTSPCFSGSKKIAYAVSMGDIKYKKDEMVTFSKYVESFDYISIRETYANTFLEDNLAIQSECLLDPTLLLDSYFYNGYEDPIDRFKLNNEFVLVYFPAEVNVCIIEAAKKYASSKGLSVVFLARTSAGLTNETVIVNASIGEFLSLLKNSRVVFCDSFHAVCFSIIYKKNFFAFPRDDGKKVKDICARFGLVNRFVEGDKLDLQEIDYVQVYEILDVERRKSIKWLEAAIKDN